MINYDHAAAALTYLVDTDEECGRAKALYDGLYEQRKTVRALQFLNNEGSAALRMETALASKEYINHLSAIRDAQIDFEILRNKRLTNQTIIEMWSSWNRNQKKGNM